MYLIGTYQDGAIIVDSPVSFQNGEKIYFTVNSPRPERRRLTYEEVVALANRVSVHTNGWKFNREEANERR
jgi:hypothetical protein